MVSAQSGCVIMDVKGDKVIYYEKCNHCQASEYDNKPWKEADWQKEGLFYQGDYTCRKCEKVSRVELKFRV